VLEHDVDVVLVIKSARKFSAAQAHRRHLAVSGRGAPRWQAKLGERLCEAATELAALATSEQLALFLGAGVSVGAGLPAWKELLTSLAERGDVPIDAQELEQLSMLDLPDQASVLCSRLGHQPDPMGIDGKAGDAIVDSYSDRSGGLASPPAFSDGCKADRISMARGERRLAELVVQELSSDYYSLSHGLLASLPVSSVVTTNYDTLFEEAWRGAQADFNVLPYETARADRWVLKLHGDLRRPQDIVLTRAQMNGYLEERGALSGIVQAMLMTKHLLFIGFSLQDPNFGEVAGTVRSVLSPKVGQRTFANGGDNGLTPSAPLQTPSMVRGSTSRGATTGATYRSGGGGTFGTLLSLHNRPFLAELWPDVRCMPMDLTDATLPHVMSNAACARILDIFLDKLSLDASTTTRHLLDTDFSGVFDADELALRSQLIDFQERLRKNPKARSSSGYAIVRETLRSLGARPEEKR